MCQIFTCCLASDEPFHLEAISLFLQFAISSQENPGYSFNSLLTDGLVKCPISRLADSAFHRRLGQEPDAAALVPIYNRDGIFSTV